MQVSLISALFSYSTAGMTGCFFSQLHQFLTNIGGKKIKQILFGPIELPFNKALVVIISCPPDLKENRGLHAQSLRVANY